MKRPFAPVVRRAAALALALAACTPTRQAVGPGYAPARIANGRYVTADGARLPLRVWRAAGRPRAVVLALHGMNDYSRQFEMPAASWSASGIAVYAYDQRGFGGGPLPGIWPGVALMVRDLRELARLLRARHPGVPVYVLGASMGGAVALAALGGPNPPAFDGAILAAPAVWGRETMPPFYPEGLFMAAHSVPWLTISNSTVRRKATDNIAILRAMGRDPLVLKSTRVDTAYGMVNLMDAALKAAPRLRVPILVLYGEKDEIIRSKPTLAMLEGMPKARLRVALYAEGWHMLLRDKQRAVVFRDVASWITDRAAPLPSGADRRDYRLLARKKP